MCQRRRHLHLYDKEMDGPEDREKKLIFLLKLNAQRRERTSYYAAALDVYTQTSHTDIYHASVE